MADFEWFRSFVSIYRFGSVSKAAHYRMMTQPALSQHLASLEAEIGEPLFVRSPKQMLPTAKGKELYNQVVEAVDRLEKVSGQFRDADTSSLVRIGAPAEFFHERIAPNWNREDVDLEISFGLTRPLLESLKKGELDLVIATQQIAMPGLVFTKLAPETFLLVGDAAHREKMNARGEETVPAVLEKMRWISYGMEMPIIRRFWLETFHVRPSIRPHCVVPDLRTIKTMVLGGLGISVLPDYLVKDELVSGKLHELWQAPSPVQNDLWLVHRSSDQENEPLLGVMEAIRALV